MKRTAAYFAALAAVGFATTPCTADANIVHVAGRTRRPPFRRWPR